MSVAGILSSSLFNYISQIPQGKNKTPSMQSGASQFQQEFQQLGQDLQSGSLATAQTDFAALQKMVPVNATATSLLSGNSLAQQFTQLSSDLQSGNLTGAQQDYATIQQDLQSQTSQMGHHHHHHHVKEGATGESASNPLLAQLAQALQTGNLTAAQQAYSTLQTSMPAMTF